MQRLYAVGDVHGSLGKLRSLLAQCERDAAGAPMAFVFVGDYIDRGPDSRGVIETVMALQARLPGAVVTLMGNHEALALAAIDSGLNVGGWLLEGGDETLLSYGVSNVHELPTKTVAWLRSLRMRSKMASRTAGGWLERRRRTSTSWMPTCTRGPRC